MKTMNSMNLLSRCGALALTLLCLNASACPQKVPSGLSATTVGEDVVVDGLPVSILLVQGREPMGELLARMEKQWIDAGYKVKRNNASGWEVLSALSDRCLTTLQLTERGGSFGYMAVNNMKKAARVSRSDMPVPPGARIKSTVDSNDDGRRGTIMSLAASMPLMAANEFYMRRLTEEKWNGVRSNLTMDSAKQPKYAIVSGQRGRDRIEVVIWRDTETQVVVNRAESL